MNKLILALSVTAALAATEASAFNSKYTQDCKQFGGASSALTYNEKEAGVSEKAGPALEKALQLMQAGKNSDAVTELNAIVANAKRPADAANANYLLSSAYYNMRQLDNAEKSVREALKNASLLTPEQQQQLNLNLAYIYASINRFSDALSATQEYYRIGGAQNGMMYVIAAMAYSQIGKQRDAICAAYVGLGKGGSPKALYGTLISAHWTLNDFEELPEIINEAAKKNPEDGRYYSQLATVYLQLKDDKQALAAYEKAYEKGALVKESDLTNMAALYEKAGGAPEKSAQLVEDSIGKGKLKDNERNWKMAAQFWTHANKNEKTIGAYAAAGKLVDHGEYDLYQGQIYADIHKWPESAKAFDAAIKKGKLKDEGNAWLSLGIAQYRSAQFKESMTSLKKAATFESAKKEAMKMMKTVEIQL